MKCDEVNRMCIALCFCLTLSGARTTIKKGCKDKQNTPPNSSLDHWALTVFSEICFSLSKSCLRKRHVHVYTQELTQVSMAHDHPLRNYLCGPQWHALSLMVKLIKHGHQGNLPDPWPPSLGAWESICMSNWVSDFDVLRPMPYQKPSVIQQNQFVKWFRNESHGPN